MNDVLKMLVAMYKDNIKTEMWMKFKDENDLICDNLNNKGITLYKEKQYAQALQQWDNAL